MRPIDVLHLGHEHVICCWQVGDVLIDPGPASCLPALLAALGDERPRALYLTHIHLDHAGAAGSLVARWPELEVHVHANGAPHLADPTRLLRSAQRLYGGDMERLWGEFLAVPTANLRVLAGGERLPGGFDVAYTPGHASHHVSYLHRDSATAFVGDVGGVRIPGSALVVPPTPPPDIDLELWLESLAALAAWRPRTLAMTHFGTGADPPAQLAEVGRRLREWAELARASEQDAFVAVVEAAIERAAPDPATAAAYVQAAAPEQLYRGLARYWRKRAEAG